MGLARTICTNENGVLDRLAIGGSATKTEYEIGDTFDPIGLTVNAIYTLEGVDQKLVDVTKDVVWDFIVENLKQEHEVIENPVLNHVAMYGQDGGMAIAQSGDTVILIEAETPKSAEELAHAIADPINECEDNGDLYAYVGEAEFDDAAPDGAFRCFGAICAIFFYHTDINE